MTFASEITRFAFHQLPTETQVRWSDFENRLAAKGMTLHIDAVQRHETALEVVLRIFSKVDGPLKAFPAP